MGAGGQRIVIDAACRTDCCAICRIAGLRLGAFARTQARAFYWRSVSAPGGCCNAERIHRCAVECGQWIRDHATQATQVGQQTGRVFVQILIGMVIGAMAALYDTTQIPRFKPLASALHERVATLHQSFRRVVFAQVRIAAINAAFTAIYLAVALPLAGIKLPLVKTMILVTFIAGLLPVIGNLISNSVIVMVSLSYSLGVAMASLLFLVTIHKLEYFLNARIIGTQINARAWELLAAMLVMEALFGIPGVIAAPVFYAYLKHELQAVNLV